MPFTTRQIEGELELKRIAYQAGYGGPAETDGDINAWLSAVEDFAVGLKAEIDKRQANTIDNFGMAAHAFAYSQIFHHLFNGLDTQR